jgi:hypothetical protein
MKKAVWLSFDLGIKGDYEGLYQWLDAHGAVECGDSVAFFKLESDGADLPGEVKKSLEESIEVDAKTRVYIVYRRNDKSMRGTFLLGQRKAPPWAGSAPGAATEEDE